MTTGRERDGDQWRIKGAGLERALPPPVAICRVFLHVDNIRERDLIDNIIILEEIKKCYARKRFEVPFNLCSEQFSLEENNIYVFSYKFYNRFKMKVFIGNIIYLH